MAVFSTFAERGPCGCYLGLVAVAMLVSRRWRVLFGWPVVILLLSCIALTMSRGGIILVILGAVLFPMVNGGRRSGPILLIALVIGGGAFFGFVGPPAAGRRHNRFFTFQPTHRSGSILRL